MMTLVLQGFAPAGIFNMDETALMKNEVEEELSNADLIALVRVSSKQALLRGSFLKIVNRPNRH